MATQYTLHFSDPSKTENVIITGPIRNNFSTSLDLVGPGYVAYGQAIAQDFLKLLENFASPNPPLNPIEGQLWYDTSNPGRKVLRVNNGAATSARWPSANGIYQQANDPGIQYSQNLIDGDVWVDTGNTQLKIRYGDSWTLVGPNVSTGDAKTGNESVNLVSNTGETYPVILNWANGKVVEIISYNSFTPRTVIDGFASLNPGINLTTKVSAKYNGLADRAKTLEISDGVYVQASEVLKNIWPSSQRQTHSGSLIVESPLGLFVKRQNGREIQIYTTSSGAIINYDNDTSAFKIGIHNRSYIRFNATNGNVGINTSTVESVALSVNGAATFKDSITINGSTTTDTLVVAGRTSITGDLTLVGNVNITGQTTISNSLTVSDIVPDNLIRSIGTPTKPFENIYVANIGNTSTYVRIFGSVTTATQLESNRNFRVSGHSTSSAVAFNGTTNVTFTTTLTRSAISSPVGGSTATTTATQTLLVLNTASATSELQSISKSNFLSDVYPGLISTGMIMGYVTPGPYPGWLYCDGTEYIASNYLNLYGIMGDRYSTSTVVTPGYFKVPNLTTATLSGTNGHPIYYHIKT
jgi:microcystin-dependent protein